LARRGVLIKGGAALEAVGKITALATDKTGTITEGRPRVTQIIPFNSTSAGDILRVAAGELPPEVERPVLAPVSSIMGEILLISLTSDKHTPIELRTTADTVIRRRILSVPGVSQVTPIGGGVKQFQAVISPAKLQTYGLSLKQVTRALAEGNENVSAGFINQRSAEWLITGVGRVRSLEDIGNTVVMATNGIPVKVADLG